MKPHHRVFDNRPGPLVRYTRDGIRCVRRGDGTGWDARDLVTGAWGPGRTREAAAEAARRRADCLDYHD